MATQNTKTKIKFHKVIDDETIIKDSKNRINPKLLKVIVFFSSILLIFSTYAWLSVSLNVKVKFIDMVVSSDSGLFISLDGIDYSDSVVISLNSVITDLRTLYPNHTNQWSVGGLWPVSSNGIKTSNNNKFDVYIGEVGRYKRSQDPMRKKYLNTVLVSEDTPNTSSIYLAFDLFLKNVSGSPKSDNLYLEDTYIDFDETKLIDLSPEGIDDIKTSMSGIMNSMRFGFVKINSVSSKSSVATIQNMTCNSECEMVIYEPNNTSHSEVSVEKAQEYGINLTDGEYSPTYGVISEGKFLEHKNGQIGSGIPLDTTHFALQNTIKDFERPIFQIPNGITKVRAYVWIEGQDMDSLETNSKGADVFISINFEKDLAGYE